MIDFSQPAEIDAATAAFPASVRNLMPDYKTLCDEWDKCGGDHQWSYRLFADWFYWGINSTDGLIPREGIDKAKALRHIRAVMGSFEPKHEHKEMGVSWLFNKWFEPTSKWERKAPKAS
jgi:hypothetical protein